MAVRGLSITQMSPITRYLLTEEQKFIKAPQNPNGQAKLTLFGRAVCIGVSIFTHGEAVARVVYLCFLSIKAIFSRANPAEIKQQKEELRAAYEVSLRSLYAVLDADVLRELGQAIESSSSPRSSQPPVVLPTVAQRSPGTELPPVSSLQPVITPHIVPSTVAPSPVVQQKPGRVEPRVVQEPSPEELAPRQEPVQVEVQQQVEVREAEGAEVRQIDPEPQVLQPVPPPPVVPLEEEQGPLFGNLFEEPVGNDAGQGRIRFIEIPAQQQQPAEQQQVAAQARDSAESFLRSVCYHPNNLPGKISRWQTLLQEEREELDDFIKDWYLDYRQAPTNFQEQCDKSTKKLGLFDVATCQFLKRPEQGTQKNQTIVEHFTLRINNEDHDFDLFALIEPVGNPFAAAYIRQHAQRVLVDLLPQMQIENGINVVNALRMLFIVLNAGFREEYAGQFDESGQLIINGGAMGIVALHLKGRIYTASLGAMRGLLFDEDKNDEDNVSLLTREVDLKHLSKAVGLNSLPGVSPVSKISVYPLPKNGLVLFTNSHLKKYCLPTEVKSLISSYQASEQEKTTQNLSLDLIYAAYQAQNLFSLPDQPFCCMLAKIKGDYPSTALSVPVIREEREEKEDLSYARKARGNISFDVDDPDVLRLLREQSFRSNHESSNSFNPDASFIGSDVDLQDFEDDRKREMSPNQGISKVQGQRDDFSPLSFPSSDDSAFITSPNTNSGDGIYNSPPLSPFDSSRSTDTVEASREEQNFSVDRANALPPPIQQSLSQETNMTTTTVSAVSATTTIPYGDQREQIGISISPSFSSTSSSQAMQVEELASTSTQDVSGGNGTNSGAITAPFRAQELSPRLAIQVNQQDMTTFQVINPNSSPVSQTLSEEADSTSAVSPATSFDLVTEDDARASPVLSSHATETVDGNQGSQQQQAATTQSSAINTVLSMLWSSKNNNSSNNT